MASQTVSTPVERFYSNSYLFSCVADQAYPEKAAILVCDYVGSDTRGTGRELFQRRYFEQNGGKPAKLKPLRIVHVDLSKKGSIESLIAGWRKTCLQRLRKPMEDKERETYKACFGLAKCIQIDLSKEGIRITKVEDVSGKTHGISLTMIDAQAAKGFINCLCTSPDNIRGVLNGERVLEGSGTALVEDAIVQVVRESGTQDVEIGLNALPDSEPFYEKLHFASLTEKTPEQSHALKGIGVQAFMRDFAGRTTTKA